MAYTRFFGMRSFENIVRDGRFRTPVGSTWLIGSPVILDSANPGFLLAATSAVAPGPNAGIVIFEHIQYPGLDPSLIGQGDLASVPAGRYAQMVHGPGAKVWFRNVVDHTLYDGRTSVGGSLLASSVTVSALTPGTGLVPDGAGKFKTGTSNVWLTVEQANPSTGVVEARFNF